MWELLYRHIQAQPVKALRPLWGQSNVDGAYFGTTFPHLLLMTYPALRPPKVQEAYVPRVFGFRLHQGKQEAVQAADTTSSEPMQHSVQVRRGCLRHGRSSVDTECTGAWGQCRARMSSRACMLAGRASSMCPGELVCSWLDHAMLQVCVACHPQTNLAQPSWSSGLDVLKYQVLQGNLEDDGKGTPPAVQSQAAQIPSLKKVVETV